MTDARPYQIRVITPKDNPAVARIIRTVMPEFGASGPGYSIADPEVDAMYESYSAPRSAFYLVSVDGVVVGCGGVAPLIGGSPDVCELRKMYFLPEARGMGAGRDIMQLCIASARSFGFRNCYLESLSSMHAAHRLYERAGFTRIDGPHGATGHDKCDVFYEMSLR